jgi:DNA-binding response OmpR family regulator
LAIDKKILVIDDEAPIRRVLELKLKNRGYQVLTAENGVEGFEIITSQQPDAVITDIMMPEMDGKTLCQLANSIKEQRPFLTIVTTCRIYADEMKWINSLQDTIFMEKPFSPARVLECVEQYFQSHR